MQNNLNEYVPKRGSTYYQTINVPDLPITINVPRLMEVLSIQTTSYRNESMMKYLVGVLSKKKNIRLNEDGYGNLYVVKGKAKNGIYPAIVSHTDTVHDIHADMEVVQEDDILWSYSRTSRKQVGIGGDDKVGVFMCLDMIDRLPYVKAVFFKDEEVGCIGSGRANMDFFTDCGFVLQCDRRGSDDFIYNAGRELYGSNFEQAIAPILIKHRYSETTGMMTDVLELKSKGLSVACANMSCGYYSPHSDSEIVSIKAVQKCHNLVSEIMNTYMDTKFEHNVGHSKKPYSSYGRSYNWEDDYYDYSGGWVSPANKKDEDDDLGTFDIVEETLALMDWGLTKEDNDYYAVNTVCKPCNELLTVDSDGIKYCTSCNCYKHIPKVYYE